MFLIIPFTMHWFADLFAVLKLLCIVCDLNNNNSQEHNATWTKPDLAASSSHSGDWLHAPPTTSIGLRLSDEAVWLAVAQRVGCKAYLAYTCICGKPVDARGLHHGLSCRKSSPRQQRHSSMNDILLRAVIQV